MKKSKNSTLSMWLQERYELICEKDYTPPLEPDEVKSKGCLKSLIYYNKEAHELTKKTYILWANRQSCPDKDACWN